MKISSFGGSWVHRSGATSTIRDAVFHHKGNVSIHEDFNFPWQEIDNDHQKRTGNNSCSELNQNVLAKLFIEILTLGAVIVPTKRKKRGGVVMEASFIPPNRDDEPKICLPLPLDDERLYYRSLAVNKVEQLEIVNRYIASFIDCLSEVQLIRLIVVTAHEYGHLKSYRQANHTKALELGIKYLHQQVTSAAIVDNYTWLVFKEEYQAWHYATNLLMRCKFSEWDLFLQVKNDSLRTYIRELKLEQAKISTFYRLSSFGDDFVKNCPRVLFKG